MIRSLFIFRVCIYFWGSYLENKKDRDRLSIISFLFDSQMMYGILSKSFLQGGVDIVKSTQTRALVHSQGWVPLSMQASRILAAFIAFLYELYY